MKTGVATINLEGERSDITGTSEKKTGKGLRRTLQPLQEAAGDKENLVGAGRPTKQMPPVKEVTIVVADSKAVKKSKLSTKAESKPTVTEDDLTSEDGPSEGYWEILAERRRVALDAALKENQLLHEKIELLEEENAQCKTLLEETRHLVETLTEVINDSGCQADDEPTEE